MMASSIDFVEERVRDAIYEVNRVCYNTILFDFS